MVFFSQNRTKCANFERKESMKRRIIPSALEIIKRGILPLQMAKKQKMKPVRFIISIERYPWIGVLAKTKRRWQTSSNFLSGENGNERSYRCLAAHAMMKRHKTKTT